MLTVQFMSGNLVYYKIPDSQNYKETYNWKNVYTHIHLLSDL